MDTYDVTEGLGNGILRHRIADNRIVIYTTNAATRAAVDTWANAVLHDVRNWRSDSPYLIVHNFLKVAVTPYNRKVAEDVCRSYPIGVSGRIALVLTKGPIGFAFHLYTQRVLSGLLPRAVEPGFFYDLDSAINWLKVLLPDE